MKRKRQKAPKKKTEPPPAPLPLPAPRPLFALICEDGRLTAPYDLGELRVDVVTSAIRRELNGEVHCKCRNHEVVKYVAMRTGHGVRIDINRPEGGKQNAVHEMP